MSTYLFYITRMIVSCICGILIGIERKNRAKEAGVRTHCIVACAACLMMLISKYGFFDLIQHATNLGMDVRLDPSRLAQGIVTGVGFLGAGTIYIQRGSIKGLTTASGIWATSGIGMAIGAGMYVVGISATVILLVVQVVLHKKTRFMTQHKTRTLSVFAVTEDNYQEKITHKMEAMGINASEVSIKQNTDHSLDYNFHLEMPENVSEEEIVRQIEYRCAVEFI